MTRREHDIEQLAIKLPEAAFPGSRDWSFCAEDTRERWIRAATVAREQTERAIDQLGREGAAT